MPEVGQSSHQLSCILSYEKQQLSIPFLSVDTAVYRDLKGNYWYWFKYSPAGIWAKLTTFPTKRHWARGFLYSISEQMVYIQYLYPATNRKKRRLNASLDKLFSIGFILLLQCRQYWRCIENGETSLYINEHTNTFLTNQMNKKQ